MNESQPPMCETGRQLRELARSGRWSSPTSGQAPGYVQANVVILPAANAADFARFAEANPRPCPLLCKTAPGDPVPRAAAAGADLRYDVPRYRVFRDGEAEAIEPADVAALWRDDLVGFLLGCSFTFETALLAAGLPVRHLQQQCNVPMYRTTIQCKSAGKFSGPMVVSMRPFAAGQIDRVVEITGRYARMHGAPIHVGDPAAIGIDDLARPDFGDAAPIRGDDVPVFWACGVTSQLAILQARPELAITHCPGFMFVTDWRDEEFCE